MPPRRLLSDPRFPRRFPGRMGDSSRQIAGFGPTFFNLCNVTLGAGILSYPVRPHTDPSLLCLPPTPEP